MKQSRHTSIFKMPSTNAYKMEPAAPVLAHTLLQPPVSPSGMLRSESASEHKSSESTSYDTWNLKLDIDKGLQSSPDHIFRPGTVLGFSRLRGGIPAGNDDEFVGELPRYLLTKWLLHHTSPPYHTSPPSPPNPTANPNIKNSRRAFIIHPLNSTIFSPEKLLTSLLSSKPEPGKPPLTRPQVISYLDSVQLFPVFDFAAAVQAINEVSDMLHDLWKYQQNEDELRNHCEVLLIITGLDTLTEAVIRSSNAVRGTAILNCALRTLTQLSRMHRSYLFTVLVNTNGVGPMVLNDSGRNSLPQTNQSREDSIHSAFCVMNTPLFRTLLMRTLDQGIDTHLLVSNTKGVPVVEVIKDRVGNGVGRWCLWDGNRSR